MPEGRTGHASVVAMVVGQEIVILAGGWNSIGDELSSVDMYNPETDQWSGLARIMKPRVYFALQVLQSLHITYYYILFTYFLFSLRCLA